MNYQTIFNIVDDFYKKANHDILIGYHFRVIEDFDHHIPRIADFWNLQLNGKMEDRSHLPFNLLTTHMPLKINMGEIHRWVVLFEETLNEHCLREKISKEDVEKWLLRITPFKEKIKTMVMNK